jgi:hypothetical protein
VDGSGSVDLEIKWGGAEPGKATICGIYTIRDDELWFCFVDKGYQRPSEFSTKVDDGRTSLVFKRTRK